MEQLWEFNAAVILKLKNANSNKIYILIECNKTKSIPLNKSVRYDTQKQINKTPTRIFAILHCLSQLALATMAVTAMTLL